MKKIMVFVISFIMFAFTINVNASSTAAKEGEDNYNFLLTEYNKGIQKINVTGTQTITLYGFSECSSSGCSYKYSKTSDDFREVLKKAITCNNGEKYIKYQDMQNSEIFYKNGIDEHNQRVTGKIAWSEDFSITCTNSQTDETGQVKYLNLSDETSSGSDFPSSGTTTNEDKGVETYYIILGIVGIITYLLTVVVKKQNLFKKV